MKKNAIVSILLSFCMLFSACSFFAPLSNDWNPSPDNPPDGGGNTPAPTYTISFVTGVAGLEVAPITKEGSQPVSAPQDPVREGYVFKGWFRDLDETPYVFQSMPHTNITLTAKWSKLYTISFDTQTTETIPQKQYEEGAFIVLPPSPTRTNFHFNGWRLGGNAVPIVMPAEDVTFTAAWIDVSASNVLSFETDVAGVTISPIVAVAGAAITEPTAPLRAGYRFDGWYDGTTLFVFDFMPMQSVTLRAKWTQIPPLPVLRIQTSEVGNIMDVNREQYITTAITVEGGDHVSYDFQNVTAEFRGRGNGSWNDNAGTGKRGYRIKFESKRSMFGFAENKHWVLLACANQDDKSMAKNATAFGISREVLDNLEYSPNTQWVDVYFNNDYRGVYVFSEQIRVNEGRVDIESEYGELDTGYLIEYDGYADNPGTGHSPMVKGIEQFRISASPKSGNTLVHAFAVKSPDPDGIAEGKVTESVFRNQISFIQEYTSRAMHAVLDGDYKTFASLCDVDSFVDMFLIQEYFKNKDCGFSSLYLYKKPGGKLYMGPVWDFDYSAGCYDGNINPEGFYNVAGGANAYNFGLPWATSSQMFLSLYPVPEFYAKVVARWKQVSPDIKAFVQSFLSDEFIAEKTEAFAKNLYNYRFAYGGSYNTGNYENDMNHARNRWVGRTTDLRTWLLNRAAWLDTNWV